MYEDAHLEAAYEDNVAQEDDDYWNAKYDDDPEHTDYPHEPGRLYDCPACEMECFCDTDNSPVPCIYCGE